MNIKIPCPNCGRVHKVAHEGDITIGKTVIEYQCGDHHDAMLICGAAVGRKKW